MMGRKGHFHTDSNDRSMLLPESRCAARTAVSDAHTVNVRLVDGTPRAVVVSLKSIWAVFLISINLDRTLLSS